MVIDQTKLLDNISKKVSNDVTDKGISNFTKTATEKTWMASEQYTKNSVSSIVKPSGSVYTNPFMEQDDTVAKQLETKSDMSAENRRNQMVVLSNTMSEEDYSKLQEDGISVNNVDSHVILSESDQIKAAMAKTGADISKYGDLSSQEIELLAGNDAISLQIQQTMKANDLPVTEQNQSEMKEALKEACSVVELSEDAKSYLIKNNLAPTIENIYVASHSGKEISASYQQENDLSDEELEEMKAQIEEIISKSGLQNTEESIQNSNWLIKNGISLTGDNIRYLQELNGIILPKDKIEEIINAMADAIKEGNRPKDAMVLEGYSLSDKAKEIVETVNSISDAHIEYCIQNDLEVTIDNLHRASESFNESITLSEEKELAFITAKRQLEEIRLMMTTEANLALLKKGIAIDTTELEKVVESLKLQEQNYYSTLLSLNDVEQSSNNLDIFSETISTFEELKVQPAYALSTQSGQESPIQLLEKGQAVKASFEQANERYETMMTAPRADLGDNINKAFQNVDEILDDLGLEKSQENQRAVRILAYNSTDINQENIMKMKNADELVQRAFSDLTPKVVMQMIRGGISPLDMTIEELNFVAVELKKNMKEDDQEKFSKYLWKLEQNKEITEVERRSYIGIYRLISQVEKTDGAVIGSLINQGADITMRNLLTAVRNNKKSGMEYEITEEFAGVDSKSSGEKIDEQIESAYIQNCIKDIFEVITPEKLNSIDWENMSPEEFKAALLEVETNDDSLDKEYSRMNLAEFQEAATASEEVYGILERYDITNSVANVMAMSEMLRNPNNMFNRLLKTRMENESPLEMLEDFKEEILEAFGEAVKTPEEFAKAQEELAERAEHAMDSMIIENEDISTIDLRELQLMKNQFVLCGKKAKEESFMIPLQTNDGVVGVSLKVIRTNENKGMVDIFFHGALTSKIAASFEAKQDKITGVIAVSDQETRNLIADNVGIIATKITQKNMEAVELSVALVPDLSAEKFELSSIKKESILNSSVDTKKEMNPVQTKRLYGVAESFIRSMEELTL